MADKLHLGCGEDYLEGWHNVDYVASVNPDEVVNLNNTPWPWEDDRFARIRAFHVVEHLDDMVDALYECERVLSQNGILKIKVPIGTDAFADPDHKHRWDWRTPEFYTGERHWDINVGLEVIEKDVSLWTAGQSNPLAALDKLSWKVRKFYDGLGSWCFNQSGSSGEFTVVFQNR